MNNDLESLMRDVARTVQADARRREMLPEIERRLAALDGPRPRARLGFRLTMVGAAACAAAGALFFFGPRIQPLSYSVSSGPDGAGRRAGGIGERLVGPTAGALAVRFSDGSEVMVPSRALAHVDALDARGAVVALEEGTVDVSVVHRDRTRWEVRAGRYQIHVTGTRFSAGWDARAQSLTVTMREGSVAVTGPGLKEPMRVVTGQRLRANARAAADPHGEEPLVSIEDADAPDTSALPAGVAGVVGDRDADKTGEAPVEKPAVEAARPASAPPAREAAHAIKATPARVRRAVAAPQALARADADWRGQASHGQYREALASALHDGWSGNCDRLGVEDLMLLGDVARFAGDLSRADEAYLAARRRFPGADRPIYFLGLVAFEGRHDYAGAARLFDAYVRYFPRGPLAREAAGRLIEARLKAGETGAAREASSSYLRAYPDGPHARLARQTVGP